MKRRIIAAIIIVMMMGLCACAKSEEKPADIQQEVTEAPTKEAEKETAKADTEKPKDNTETAKEPETEEDSTSDEAQNDIIHLTCTVTNEGRSVGGNYAGEAYIRYPKFDLYESDAKNYPKLRSALEKLGKRYEAEYAEHLEYSHGIGEEALADGVNMEINFFDYLTPEVCRADSHIVSIRENYDTYTGGVHGYNSFYGDNYDSKTGKELYLKDVVTDMDVFKETVKEKLYEKYPGEEFGDLDEALADLGPAMGDVSIWTMDYSGITLYFNPYYLTAYASGMQVITVPFNENPSLFVQDYLDIPDVYAEQLNERVPAVIDVNGDGMNEGIIITEELPEEEMNDEGYDTGYRTWTVYCGGDSLTVSDYCYRAKFYLVHANDQYYIHIFEVSDNDYSLFTVVDLKDMKNDKDKSFNASLMMYDTQYDSDDSGYSSIYTEDVYTDPENVYISSRTEVLGSNSGVRLYGIGRDGWLKPLDAEFMVYTTMVYTAKDEIPCAEVDEAGNGKGEAVLKAGKYYHLVRTDNKTYADIQELDKDEVEENDSYPYIYANDRKGLDSTRPIYRIPYDDSEYPHTVYGTSEDDLFDGILYAG